MEKTKKQIAQDILKSVKGWTKRYCTASGLEHPTGKELTRVAIENAKHEFPHLYQVLKENGLA